jgi:hypothetical protein
MGTFAVFDDIDAYSETTDERHGGHALVSIT